MNLVLLEVEQLLQANQRSLRDYPSMLYPENGNFATHLDNVLILSALNFNNEDLISEFLYLFSQMTGLFIEPATCKPHKSCLAYFSALRFSLQFQTAINVKTIFITTNQQATTYNQIIQVVNQNEGGMFFLYGDRGTRKTFIWKALTASLRAYDKIVIMVAFSGIASLLLPGGRTTHSKFKIPKEHNWLNY